MVGSRKRLIVREVPAFGQKDFEEKDVRGQLIADARRKALIQVGFVSASIALFAVAAFILRLWLGFAVLGGFSLWLGGVMHMPRGRREE